MAVTDATSIEATSKATAITVALSASKSAFGFSGGGATALNQINGKANATGLDASALTAGRQGVGDEHR